MGDIAALSALGEMTLKAVMGALALVLGPHWAVSDEEARHWGQALEAWLKAQPPKRRKALTNALGSVPTLNLVVATGMVIAPRIQAHIALSQMRKEVKSDKGGTGSGHGGNFEGASTADSTEPYSGSYADAIKRLFAGDAGGTGTADSHSDSGDRTPFRGGATA